MGRGSADDRWRTFRALRRRCPLAIGRTAIDDLLQEATARDFVADAFAHCKFIGYVDAAMPLFEKAGIAEGLDEGVISIERAGRAQQVRGGTRRPETVGTRTQPENAAVS